MRHYYAVRQSRTTNSEESGDVENELFLTAFQFEYSYVQNISQQKQISSKLVDELHKKISMDQMVYMQNGS
ncbi:hypothetical protein HC026_12160 [Lactobacillus sp. LC28-10]|uniref:Uncharacterized protein n=1 Tax=Secundilactobacillus angelensis TaxID=2722706 RepID=A0ABX1L5U7_9LACO|nr:hypothetical protein [Secundilactobacillus angelensis]MCH5462919.1 hypothetical protein [Secundilactobacillus angelensis]NLR19641.1 hypothetical protein [Secundilactobacillus angelensis]